MSSARARAIAWVASGVLGGAIVTGAVVSQLGLATAATPAPSPGQMQQYGGPGPGMMAPGMPGARLMKGLGRVTHGELQVQTGTGTFQTVVVQNGKVTAVDTANKTVTVKSADDWSATYVVDSNTRIRKDRAQAKLADLKVGDTVHVMAVKSGSTLTAKMIGDGVGPGPGRGMRGMMHGGGDADDAPQGTVPNGTATQGTST